MTICKSLAAVAFGLVSIGQGPAFADVGSGCHFHGSKPASEATVVQCASKRIETLISSGKIEAAWKGKTHDTLELVEAKKGKEWKLTYSLPTAKDPQKTKLYLFYTHSGNFLAANHTGK